MSEHEDLGKDIPEKLKILSEVIPWNQAHQLNENTLQAKLDGVMIGSRDAVIKAFGESAPQMRLSAERFKDTGNFRFVLEFYRIERWVLDPMGNPAADYWSDDVYKLPVDMSPSQANELIEELVIKMLNRAIILLRASKTSNTVTSAGVPQSHLSVVRLKLQELYNLIPWIELFEDSKTHHVVDFSHHCQIVEASELVKQFSEPVKAAWLRFSVGYWPRTGVADFFIGSLWTEEHDYRPDREEGGRWESSGAMPVLLNDSKDAGINSLLVIELIDAVIAHYRQNKSGVVFSPPKTYLEQVREKLLVLNGLLPWQYDDGGVNMRYIGFPCLSFVGDRVRENFPGLVDRFDFHAHYLHEKKSVRFTIRLLDEEEQYLNLTAEQTGQRVWESWTNKGGHGCTEHQRLVAESIVLEMIDKAIQKYTEEVVGWRNAQVGTRTGELPASTEPVVTNGPSIYLHDANPNDELSIVVDPESLYGILPDFAIRHYAEKHGMIENFIPEQIRKVDLDGREIKIISKGTTSFGYDITLGREFRLFTNTYGAVIDPKKFSNECTIEIKAVFDDEGCEYVILPPNGYLLGVSVEKFKIPPDILVVCLGKSTYARAGAIINVTPMEPDWQGQLVVEIANGTPLPMKIYANEGIAQALFLRGEHRCSIPYSVGGRKYQGQQGLVLPRV